MKNIHFVIIFIVLLGLGACIDQIPFIIEENENLYLIVNAELRDNTENHSVRVEINSEESNDFQANFPVENAQVRLIEDDQNEYEFKFEPYNKTYNYNGLKLKTGSSYHLDIVFNDITYRSSKETLLSSVPLGSVDMVYSIDDETNSAGNIQKNFTANLFANSQLPAEETYLQYRLTGAYEFRERGTQQNLNPKICYVTEIIDLDNLALVDSKELQDGLLSNKKILQKNVDYRFAINYCMKVYQERISKTAFDFWKLVENEYQRTGDIFEKPPGVLRGNVIEQKQTDISVVGLFSVIAVDSMNVQIKPAEVESPRDICRSWPTRPSSCNNCLLIENSSLVKPDCFY